MSDPGLRLTLLRHAHAAAAPQSSGDFERTLDRRGLAEAVEMGRRCRLMDHRPDLIVSSPALRAVQTAETLLRALDLPGRALRLDPPCYLAEAPLLLERLAALAGTEHAHVFIVAHNPGLSELARQLAPRVAPAAMDTAGLCAMRLTASSWLELGLAEATSALYDSPQRPFNDWE